MRMKPTSMLSALLLLLALPLAANADLPGKHPYYLHALTDLRTARGDAARAAACLGWTPLIGWTQTLQDVLTDWRQRVAAAPEGA